MSKKLILTEKPSVGKDIGRVLNCNIKKNGYWENDKFIVTWALGHLVTLATPDKYSEKYKTWEINDLPILPKNLKLEVIKKTSRQFNTVKRLLKNPDVNEIIIATDAGREGELVARWIIELSYVKKPVKRLWISSVTDKAIKDGFKNLKNGSYYDNLYYSAKARAEADWLIGLNASRALTCKYNAQLSCGRVQTPTLSIIFKKEEEIQNFKPKKYYKLKASSNSLSLYWHDSNNNPRIYNKQTLDNIMSSILQKDAKVIDISAKNKKTFPPMLYDLTELQRDANKIFDFSAKETLSIIQRLYEHHKVVTYPRTDSRYITTDMVDTLKDRILACKVKPYTKLVSNILKDSIKTSKYFVDNGKVSDHHAIIPTEETALIKNLSNKERKVYDLIVRRFLGVFHLPYEYKEVSIKTSIDNEIFITSGKTTISNGWKEAFDNNSIVNDEISLPNFNKGDIIKITSIDIINGETKAPSRFTEATLLSAMENPQKYMDKANSSLLKTIDTTGGLGTVATRADIIEKLFASFFIEKNGKEINITSKGKQLLSLVPADIKSPELTAKWEQKLAKIANGSYENEDFINNIKEYTKKIVDDIKNSTENYKHDNITKNRCPECSKFLLEINGKRGKSLVCQDKTCGYKKLITQTTNARCPNCHKKLELHGEGNGKLFTCKCGYREKLSAFNKRKKVNTNTSKKEISKYLNKQKQENDIKINLDFAKALEKLNL